MMATSIEKENKVVIHNNSATIVIVNGSTKNISVTTPESDHSLKFSGLRSLEIFVEQCYEVCNAARKEMEFKNESTRS
jgi:hypothetical protein